MGIVSGNDPMKLTRLLLTAFASSCLLVSSTAAQEESSDDLRTTAELLGQELEALAAECTSLYARYEEAEGEAKILAWTILSRRGAEAEEKLAQFVEDLVALRERGQAVGELQQQAKEVLAVGFLIMRTDIQRRRDKFAKLMGDLPEIPGRNGFRMEQLLTSENVEMDLHLESYLRFCGFKENLQLDPTEELEYFEPLLLERATDLLGLLEAALNERQEIKTSMERLSSEEAEVLASELSVVEERLHWVTNSLDDTVSLMDERGFETIDHKQALILARGGFTTDIFETGVAVGLLQRSWDQLKDWFAENGIPLILRTLLFLVIVILSIILARVVGRFLTNALTKTRSKMPVLLKEMISSITSKLVFLLGLLIAVSTLGIELGPVLAGLGIAGFVIGFALQDSLSNFAAGMMILIYRPFDLGDTVEAAGVKGKVSHMSLVTTSILTFDNQTLIIPNGKVWGDVIRNVNAQPTRRVDMVFRIGHREDIAKAERILREIVEKQDQILDEPKPEIKIDELGEWSIDFIVRPWARTEDYWDVYHGVTRMVKERFDAEGIPLPYPQHSVHLQGEDKRLKG